MRLKPLFHLSRQEKTLLTLAGGAAVLLWIVLVFSLISLYGLSPLVHADATPGLAARATSASAPPGSNADASFSTSSLSLTSTPPLVETVALPPLPTWTPTPTATRPAGVSMVPLGDDTVVIALLGIDERQTAGIWRTDSIVLAFVQLEPRPTKAQIALLSIPRDLWVYIPEHGYDRINTVDALGERTHYPGGGRGLLDQTLRHNLGIPVHHYVRVDFQGFVRIVDALGGVTVNVEKPLTDTFPDPLSPTGTSTISLSAGLHHLDGRTALSYCRSRMTTDDFDRSRRQLQVLQALARQALVPERLAQAPNLWATFNDAFDTDISMIKAALLATFVKGVGPENMRSKHLNLGLTRPWTTPQGAQVLLPQTDAIQQTILQLLAD